MERDLRHSSLYRAIERHFQRAYAPAFGRISGASDVAPAPDGRRIAFVGSRRERLEGTPSQRIVVAEAPSGTYAEVTAGPNDDTCPRWSPDGRWLAFLSDRERKGQAQLYLLEAGRAGEARATPRIEGTVEYLAWAPDGRAVLLGVAGAGADLAGVQGSGTTAAAEAELPDWMPEVDGGIAENQRRRLWLYELERGTSQPLSRPGLNVWEATWAGPERIAAIISSDPSEDAWYTAPLALVDRATGREQILYRSEWQLGLPAASPSGRRIAVVEAICSDRAVVAGEVLLLDVAGGAPRRLDSAGVDVACLAWRDEEHLFFAGLRGLESVFGEWDLVSGRRRELLAMRESAGLMYPAAAPLGTDACALVLESYTRYPELALAREGAIQTVCSLAHDGSVYLGDVSGRLEEVNWTAADGLEIQGLLALPDGPGPFALIDFIHGGPVWAYRSRWSMGSGLTALLVSRGYAVLHPNPRGSTGRGRAFVERVYGDMGGGETGDHLAGVDTLVARGIADPRRLGVMGGSHGGFMASWIITQTDRFAAAVPISPVTDWLSQHYTSNIGYFDRIFLRDEPTNLAGRYFTRSPVQLAHKVRTPTLQTTGARDRCTPAGQAIEFHHALLEQSVESVLVVYPQEGHGVRQFPAVIDQCTRVVGWFERHMPAKTKRSAKPARDKVGARR